MRRLRISPRAPKMNEAPPCTVAIVPIAATAIQSASVIRQCFQPGNPEHKAQGTHSTGHDVPLIHLGTALTAVLILRQAQAGAPLTYLSVESLAIRNTFSALPKDV